MEPITVKFEEGFVHDIERVMKKHRYSTKAEFIREAIREKIKELEEEDRIKKLDAFFGSSKRKTTDEEIHTVGEKAFEILAKKHKIK